MPVSSVGAKRVWSFATRSDGHAQNEHFCLELARDLGLPVAASRIVEFEDQVAIVVEGYDRILAGQDVVRVHQEDFCQALGIHPSKKYETEGGPGIRQILSLLSSHANALWEDADTFVRAQALNWFIAGTDGHAKNYSVLIGQEGRVAPLYDIASVLPYATQFRKLNSP